MKIPTYEEYLKNAGLSRDDLTSELSYKALLGQIIRVALDNMMLQVYHKQKECTVEQMYSIAYMFHALNSFFVIPKEK